MRETFPDICQHTLRLAGDEPGVPITESLKPSAQSAGQLSDRELRAAQWTRATNGETLKIRRARLNLLNQVPDSPVNNGGLSTSRKSERLNKKLPSTAEEQAKDK